MAKVRVAKDILNDMIAAGRIANPYRSWEARSPEADILTAGASEFAIQYTHLDYVRNLVTLSGYEKLQSDGGLRSALMTIWGVTETELDSIFQTDLDNYAELYGLTRHSSSKATGTLQLTFADGNIVTIPKGTKFISVARRKEYITVEEINRSPSLINGLYTIRVMVECTESGADGNIALGSYLIPENSIAKLSQTIVPVSIVNGEDTETNVDFVARIRLARTSRGVGSRTWLRNLLLADERVYDVWLNAKGDTGFERPTGIDAWVYAKESPVSTSDTMKGTSGYNPEFQPLIDENPIITPNYVLTKDEGNYKGSVDALDSIAGAEGATVEYYYDKTIRDLQLKVEDADNWLLGGRRIVLVKKAKPVSLLFKIKVYYVFGSDVATVKENITNNLFYFLVGGTTSYGEEFDRLGLGVKIDKSDLLNVVLETEGVDRVDITGSNAFAVYKDSFLAREQDPIRLNGNQYPKFGSIKWL